MEKSGSFIQGELIDITVSDLQPSTAYVFRTRAVNEHGTGAVSMEFPFTTGIDRDDNGLLASSPGWGQG